MRSTLIVPAKQHKTPHVECGDSARRLTQGFGIAPTNGCLWTEKKGRRGARALGNAYLILDEGWRFQPPSLDEALAIEPWTVRPLAARHDREHA